MYRITVCHISAEGFYIKWQNTVTDMKCRVGKTNCKADRLSKALIMFLLYDYSKLTDIRDALQKQVAVR